jgi:aminopeptidase
MSDPRYTRLAETLIHYSCELKPDDKILIEAIDVPHEFTNELVRLAHEAGAMPNVAIKSKQVMRRLLLGATEAQLEAMARAEETVMEPAWTPTSASAAPRTSPSSVRRARTTAMNAVRDG